MARQEEQESEVIVVGAPGHSMRDLYHGLLRMGWTMTILTIAIIFLVLNAIFALGYMSFGGVMHARPGNFADAFFFSVQTMGTIGYGAMYPETVPANVLVVAESVVGLLITALATGLVFAKFSLTQARVAFSERVTISPIDGVPTLTFRVGNERRSTIVDAMVRVALVRTEITAEGVLFYRMYDLPLVRERSPAVTRSWNVFHRIDENSLLFGATPESLKKSEAELIVTLVGIDDTSLQPVHARHRYVDTEVLWGARQADILTEREDGKLVLDIRRFHETVPTKPTEGFPYPRG
ncbi:MAG: ion channel [Polyangiales bacterium]